MLLNYPCAGDRVLHDEEVLTIDFVGNAIINSLGYGPVAVRFSDGTNGIVSVRPARKVRTFLHGLVDGLLGLKNRVELFESADLETWIPDMPVAAATLRNSRELPTINSGIGSDVYHVRGVSKDGKKFLIKLYYNEKKRRGRSDELYEFTGDCTVKQIEGDRLVLFPLEAFAPS